MSDKFPYLARQINGPIAESFGKSIDSVYEKDADFIDYLSRFSIDTLEGKWLDELGLLIGLPRPWAEVPLIEETLLFDTVPNILPSPKNHALSTDRNIIVGETEVTTSMGGQFDDINKNISVEPISDSEYRKYLKCACLVKKQHSINGIANVIEIFSGSKQYVISFVSNKDLFNDILIKLPMRALNYKNTLQSAFDKMFTTAPKVLVEIDEIFDNKYIIPDVTRIIYNIVDNNNFSITNFTNFDKLIIDVTLGQINTSYKDEVKNALEEEYADYDDIVISVTIA